MYFKFLLKPGGLVIESVLKIIFLLHFELNFSDCRSQEEQFNESRERVRRPDV